MNWKKIGKGVFKMSIMEIDGFNKNDIMSKLKGMKGCPKILLTITEFVFSPLMDSLMKELDSKYDSKYGRPAYPRRMLLGVVLYCVSQKVDDMAGIARMCRENKFLQVFTCGINHSTSTFKRFLNNGPRLVFKKIFIATLVKLNDSRFLEFCKTFLDSTDAIVNGSKHYKITLDEINALKQLKKWGALHHNTKSSITKTRNILNEKLEVYTDDEEMLKLINLALGRIELYNVRMHKKRKKLESILLERDCKYVCITFPDAVMMKTKKGEFNYGLNLHQLMTEHNIILTGVLMDQPNDHYAIKWLLEDLKETIEILIEMQKEFGQRNNYKELQRRIDQMILIADSGYCSTENLHTLKEEQINHLLMPKAISHQCNNEIREKNQIETSKNDSPTSKKNFKRVKNTYICPFNQKLEYQGSKDINFRKIDTSQIPEYQIKKRYIYECQSCTGCPYIETCKHKRIEERITPLQHDMIEKFTNKRYKKMYQDRFHISEGINGFIKRTNGMFKLISPNKQAADNEMQLRNTVYNLIRTVNLKGTAY